MFEEITKVLVWDVFESIVCTLYYFVYSVCSSVCDVLAPAAVDFCRNLPPSAKQEKPLRHKILQLFILSTEAMNI